MSNKTNTGLEKKASFRFQKNIKNLYDARYDLSKIQIIPIDGVLPSIHREEARLLFFINMPNVGINSDKKEKSLNRCMVELRMSTSTLMIISEIINLELDCFEKKQCLSRESKVKIKDNENPMFG